MQEQQWNVAKKWLIFKNSTWADWIFERMMVI